MRSRGRPWGLGPSTPWSARDEWAPLSGPTRGPGSQERRSGKGGQELPRCPGALLGGGPTPPAEAALVGAYRAGPLARRARLEAATAHRPRWRRAGIVGNVVRRLPARPSRPRGAALPAGRRKLVWGDLLGPAAPGAALPAPQPERSQRRKLQSLELARGGARTQNNKGNNNC